jgi:phage-related protein
MGVGKKVFESCPCLPYNIASICGRMTWNLEFYRNSDGKAPVEEYFNTVGKNELAKIHRNLDLLEEFGIQLGFPYVSYVEGKIWELRTKASGKNHRVLYFCCTGQRIVLLHAFLKVSSKIPDGEKSVARQRMMDFLEKEGK